jgi:hypothetical protein
VYEEFQELYEQTLDMLAQVFQTTQVVPSRLRPRGLESAITSVVERGERTSLSPMASSASWPCGLSMGSGKGEASRVRGCAH